MQSVAESLRRKSSVFVFLDDIKIISMDLSSAKQALDKISIQLK